MRSTNTRLPLTMLMPTRSLGSGYN
jgi:hypothetical protein